MIISVAMILIAITLDGQRGAVLAASGLMILLTLVRLVGQQRRLRVTLRTQVAVSQSVHRAGGPVAHRSGAGRSAGIDGP